MSYFVHDSQWQEIFLLVSQTTSFLTHVLAVFIPSCRVEGGREGWTDGWTDGAVESGEWLLFGLNVVVNLHPSCLTEA